MNDNRGRYRFCVNKNSPDGICDLAIIDTQNACIVEYIPKAFKNMYDHMGVYTRPFALANHPEKNSKVLPYTMADNLLILMGSMMNWLFYDTAEDLKIIDSANRDVGIAILLAIAKYYGRDIEEVETDNNVVSLSDFKSKKDANKIK